MISESKGTATRDRAYLCTFGGEPFHLSHTGWILVDDRLGVKICANARGSDRSGESLWTGPSALYHDALFRVPNQIAASAESKLGGFRIFCLPHSAERFSQFDGGLLHQHAGATAPAYFTQPRSLLRCHELMRARRVPFAKRWSYGKS